MVRSFYYTASHLKRWTSQTYNHFTISLKREFLADGTPDSLWFIFTCKEHPDTHKPHKRKRMATSSGTGNLQRAVKYCRARNPSSLPQSDTQGGSEVPGSSNSTKRPYTVAYHRALIAIRCARNHRLANMVTDPEYLMEVEMLRPGTIVPSPSTVADDIQAIYLAASSRVKDHFKVHFLASTSQCALTSSDL